MIDPEYIAIGVFVVAGLAARELWLHIQISVIKTDIKWLQKFVRENNEKKGGEN